ncbi:unnamed protein product [Blepharisma stoltei]|uniref:Uncharacterized protein n=1 Tax=Blepharisma stoltei TaxID=1481888 RepID=A0AAU9JBU7_9CILI|nr:unnamed protein product [Blepharisma stoltei]
MESSGKLLFIGPVEVAHGEIVTLQLPRSQMPFLLTDSSIYSIQKSSFFGSCVVGKTINSSTEVFIITPFDPIFLLLPVLNQIYSFRAYEEILRDSNLSALIGKSEILAKVSKFCECKDHQGQLYVRTTEEKINEWLQMKFEALVREISVKVPWAMSIQGQNPNATKTALGILYELLNDDFFMRLSMGFTIREILITGKPQPLRRQNNEIENFKPQQHSAKKKPQPPKKAANLPKGQLTLSFAKAK